MDILTDTYLQGLGMICHEFKLRPSDALNMSVAEYAFLGEWLNWHNKQVEDAIKIERMKQQRR